MKKSVDTFIQECLELGPPCLYCGSRVADAQITVGIRGSSTAQEIMFKGMCKSRICQQLPPGGNPFMYIITDGEE